MSYSLTAAQIIEKLQRLPAYAQVWVECAEGNVPVVGVHGQGTWVLLEVGDLEQTA